VLLALEHDADFAGALAMADFDHGAFGIGIVGFAPLLERDDRG
jgi:hypothetical protein